MTLYHLNIDLSFDVDKLIKATSLLKLTEPHISDISFCPHLIGYKDCIDNKDVVTIMNVNNGYFDRVSRTTGILVKECESLKDFIIGIHSLIYYNKPNKEPQTYALF